MELSSWCKALSGTAHDRSVIEINRRHTTHETIKLSQGMRIWEPCLVRLCSVHFCALYQTRDRRQSRLDRLAHVFSFTRGSIYSFAVRSRMPFNVQTILFKVKLSFFHSLEIVHASDEWGYAQDYAARTVVLFGLRTMVRVGLRQSSVHLQSWILLEKVLSISLFLMHECSSVYPDCLSFCLRKNETAAS